MNFIILNFTCEKVSMPNFSAGHICIAHLDVCNRMLIILFICKNMITHKLLLYKKIVYLQIKESYKYCIIIGNTNFFI